MATEYRRAMIFLCVCLTSIHSIRCEDASISSNEQSETDYFRLEDLIRQQILGVIQNDLTVPDAGFYHPRSTLGGTQVRHLGPRSSRIRDFLFGANDGTQSSQSGGGGLLNMLKRRPPQQNNRVSNMNDYNVDGQYPQYIPSQTQNLMYDYLPSSGNQLLYDGYNGRPNMMWNGGGIPSGYEYVEQPLRVPGRRMGVRPHPAESYDMVGNGGFMPMVDSMGSPGSYLIQVPARGRRNNLNGGYLRPITSPSSQVISSNGGGPTTLPMEVPTIEDSSNTAGIPIRTSGKRNNRNQNSGMSMIPGSELITSGNMGIPDSEAISTDIELPRVNGKQPSSQSYTITSDGTNFEVPTEIPTSDGSSISFRLPENMNGMRVGNKSPSLNVGSGGVELGRGESPNGLKVGRGGSTSTMELPVDTNVLGLETGGNMDNVQVPSGLGGLSAGVGGLMNNIRLPANLNGLRLRTGGSSDNTEIPSNFGGLRTGSGSGSGKSSSSSGGGGIRIGQNQFTLPSTESFGLGNGESISTMEIPSDISNYPGSMSVSSGRALQTSPSSGSESIQGQPTSIVSMDESDVGPNYDIDVRDLDESAYASSPIETLTTDANPMAQTITQNISGQPSESLDIMSPDIVSSVPDFIDQEATSIHDEPISLPNDMNMNLLTGGGARNGRISSPGRMAFSQNGPESLTTIGNTNNPKRKGMTQKGGYYIIPHQDDFDIDAYMGMGDAENSVEQPKPQMSKFSTRSGMQQPMGNLSSKIGVGNGITETQGLDFGQVQNIVKPSGTRMMSSIATSDGSGTTNVGAGKNGRSRQYKVLVLDGDHELIRGLKLPGMKTNFGDSGEV